MRIDAVLIWGVSFGLFLLPVAVWQGLELLPLLIAFSYPHFVATYVIWGTKAQNWKSEIPGILFPLAYLAVCAFTEHGPRWLSSLPYQLTYIYLAYHFARQCFGAALWGGLRLGLQFGKLERRFLEAWFLAVPAVAIYALFAERPPLSLFSHPVRPWKLTATPIPYLYLALGVLLIGTCVALGVSYHKHRKWGVLWPLCMLGLPLIWFLPPFQAQEWIPIIPLLHALQYLPFWTRLLWDRPVRWYVRAAHYLGFVALGWVLFRWAPLALTDRTGRTWVYGAWIAMLNAHHFWIDGRIWKLRDERNRALFT